MDDGPGKIKFIPNHFQVPTSVVESVENRTPSITEPGTDKSSRYCFLVEKEKKKTIVPKSLGEFESIGNQSLNLV